MSERYSKMYIAVLDEAPDYMVPTLVAHSVLAAHAKFQGNFDYMRWFQGSFRKVTVRVNRREFDKIRTTLVCHEGHENTICNAEPSCLVVLPVFNDAVPNVLNYAKLWKPITGD
jgi:hypothetical protein